MLAKKKNLNINFLPKLPAVRMVPHITKFSLFQRYTCEENLKMDLVRCYDVTQIHMVQNKVQSWALFNRV
jgi:hypothetical protein